MKSLVLKLMNNYFIKYLSNQLVHLCRKQIIFPLKHITLINDVTKQYSINSNSKILFNTNLI